MTEVLILKDVAYSAKIGGGVISGINEVNLLADGAIAYFDESSNMLTNVIAAGSLLDDKYVYFAVGSGDAAIGARISEKIMRRNNAKYNKKAYVVPVKPIKYVGYNTSTGTLYPSIPVAGTVVTLRIIRQDIINPQNLPNDKTRYDYVVKSGDTTTIIINAIVAKINDNPNAPVVAANVSNLGISLTAKNFGETFEIGVADGFANALITQDAAPATLLVLGFGTPAQILALESYYDVERGHTNKVTALPRNTWNQSSKVDSAATYDVYTITWRQDHANPTGTEMGVADKEIIVAMPSGASVITQANFETAMIKIFNPAVGDSPESGV